MRDNITVALSALKVFYSEAEDAIELYGNVLLRVIGNESVSMGEAQKKIKEEFQIEIPLSILRSMARRLNIKGLIERKDRNDNMRVTRLGEQRQSELQDKFNKVSRRENAVLQKIKETQLPNEEIEDIRKYVRSFIVNNPHVSVNLMLGDENESTPLDTEIEDALRAFFIKVESESPDHYEYLKDILLGQIIASNLLEKSEGVSLKGVVFYIDTNVFLSLLDLNQDVDNKSAKDVFKLIKADDAQIKIFAHLKEETIVLLKNSINTIDQYIHDIPVDSIGYRIKHKGYDRQHIQRLIENIDVKLNEFGISIANSADKEISFAPQYYKELIDEKDSKFQPRVSIENDCRSIEIIRRIRRGARDNCYHLHKSKAVLLSSDKLIARFCRKKHSESSLTVPESFTPDQITGFLWLNDVNSKPNSYINNFLSRNIASQLVDKGMWEKFHQKLMEEEKMGKLTKSVIHYLVDNENTRAVLLEGDLEKVEKLFDDTNINRIKKEMNAAQESIKKEVNAVQKSFKKEMNALQESFKKEMNALQKNIKQKDAEITSLKNDLKKREEEKTLAQKRQDEAINVQAEKEVDKRLAFRKKFWASFFITCSSIACIAVFIHDKALGSIASVLALAIVMYKKFYPSSLSSKMRKKREKLIEAKKAKIKAEWGLDK